MTARVIDLSRARQVFEHQEALGDLVAKLSRLLELCPPIPAEDPAGQEHIVRWVRDVWRVLGVLRERVRAHFVLEEASPMYTGGEPFLRFEGALRALRAQHGQLLCAIAELETEPHPTDLHDGVLELLATLRRHEAQETRLMQRALTEDLGNGD